MGPVLAPTVLFAKTFAMVGGYDQRCVFPEIVLNQILKQSPQSKIQILQRTVVEIFKVCDIPSLQSLHIRVCSQLPHQSIEISVRWENTVIVRIPGLPERFGGGSFRPAYIIMNFVGVNKPERVLPGGHVLEHNPKGIPASCINLKISYTFTETELPIYIAPANHSGGLISTV